MLREKVVFVIMKETKDSKKVKKGKHNAKPTIGDIIFRVLVLVAIFFIAGIGKQTLIIRPALEVPQLSGL